MNSKIIISFGIVFIAAFILGCSKPQTMKLMTEKQEQTPKELVDIIEFKMEKIEKSMFGPDYGTIRIIGTAIYHGTKKFDEEVAFIVFGLYDEKGNQVRRFEVPSFACGENKNPNNIGTGKPFPFEYEDGEIKLETWKRITEARLEKITKL